MVRLFGLLMCRMAGGIMAKLRLFVRRRKQGCYIASVPFGRLIELTGYDKTRWRFEDGWLILEAF